MKKLLIFLPLFIILFESSAQTFTLIGDRSFGGTSPDVFPRMKYVGNNEFILKGKSFSVYDGDKTDALCDTDTVLGCDAWVLKIDTAFNILWNYSIGGSLWEDGESEVIQLVNGGFVTVTASASDSSCDKSENTKSFPVSNHYDYWVCRFDDNGILLWDKTYGGSDHDEATQIIQMTDGSMVIGGTSLMAQDGDITSTGFGASDYWLLKIDSSGNKIWDYAYGGDNIEHKKMIMIPESDNSFIIAGTTRSSASGTISDTSRGNYDIWLARINSNGTVLYDKRFGGNLNDIPYCIQKTTGNGYVITGFTFSDQGLDLSEASLGGSDIWVVKVDSLFNKQWDKRYGGNGNDEGRWITEESDGGFLISATVDSDTNLYISEPSYGWSDLWIFKIDNAGNKIWDKRFGGPGSDYATGHFVMADSSIFLSGGASWGSSGVKSDPGNGETDYWVVHFKYEPLTTSLQESPENLIVLNPNPSSGFVNIPHEFQDYEIRITDNSGKVVYTNYSEGKSNLDLGFLKPGCYFVNLTKGERNFRAKLILD